MTLICNDSLEVFKTFGVMDGVMFTPIHQTIELKPLQVEQSIIFGRKIRLLKSFGGCNMC